MTAKIIECNDGTFHISIIKGRTDREKELILLSSLTKTLQLGAKKVRWNSASYLISRRKRRKRKEVVTRLDLIIF